MPSSPPPLLIAALFQPLHKRIQEVLDRRFYRRKYEYDSACILADFRTTLRNEVDLKQLSKQLVAFVEESMQPAHISLWLRPPQRSGNHQAVWNSSPPESSQQQ